MNALVCMVNLSSRMVKQLLRCCPYSKDKDGKNREEDNDINNGLCEYADLDYVLKIGYT